MDTRARHVTLVGPVPGDPRETPIILTRIEQALDGLPGPWRVGLSHGTEIGWWILTASRDDGFECTLFLEGPLQQTAAHIRDRMADALQRHIIGR